MADDMQQEQEQLQHHVLSVGGGATAVDVGAHGVDVMEQHGLHAAAAAAGDYAASTEVSEDILQQALDVNNFYLSASSGTHADGSAAVAVAVPSELYANAASGGGVHVAATTVDGSGVVSLLAEGEAAAEVAAVEAPLGSRSNPIRIMQHGNQFTSMQHLMPDQLAQIMQVLQHQQQIARCAGGSTVLLQGDGSNKFVYRVMYPGDPAAKASAAGAAGRAAGNGVVTATPGARAAASRAQHQQRTSSSARSKYRGKKRKRASDEWEEASDVEWVAPESGGSDDSRAPGTEMSREEKEQRKKHRPRTRSGRVSKPPKHMVKDYKHIHPLDWDEDYDDSDGGYSDFKHSGDEGGDSKDSMDASVYSDARKRVWRCRTCGKAYIGTGGLGRHYRLHPEHGSLSDLSGPTGLLPDGTPVQLFQQSGPSNHNDLSQDSLSRDTAMSNDGLLPGLSGDVASSHVSPHFATGSVSSLDAVTPSRYLQPAAAKKIAKTPGYVPTGRPRGRPPSNPAELAERRRHRLRELVQQCNLEDLVEIVLPSLLPTVSSWEFLLMRCEEAGRAAAAAEEQERRAAAAEGRRPNSACSSGGSLILREVLREFEEVRNRAACAVKACINQQQLMQQRLDDSNAGGIADGSQLSPDASGFGMHGSVTLRIEDEAMAKALDLEVGYYDAVGELLEQSRLRQPPAAAPATPMVAPVSSPASDAAVGGVCVGIAAGATASTSSIMSGTSLLRDRSLLPSATSSTAAQPGRASVVGTQQQHTSSAAATAAEAALRHLSQKQSSQVAHGMHQGQQQRQQQQPSPSAHNQHHQQQLTSQQQQSFATVNSQRRLPSPTGSASAQQLLAAVTGDHGDLGTGEQRLQTIYTASGDVLTLSSSGADDAANMAESVDGYDDGAAAAAAAGMDQPMYTVTANGELMAADGSLVQLPEGASLVQTADGQLVIYQPQPTDAVTVAGAAALQFEGGQTVQLEGLPQGLMLAVEPDGTLRYVGADQASRMQ